MAAKIPPPPPIATSNPEFNRWLLELTSILSDEGGIDPSEVTGLTSVITQVGVNTTDITNLETSVGDQGGDISILQEDIATVNSEISTINGQITTLSSTVTSLSARNQVFSGSGTPSAGLGVNGDWYGNVGGAAGSRVYIKVSGTWTPFPF